MAGTARPLQDHPLRRGIRFAGTVAAAVIDEFILADLREGRIELRDYPWVSRQLIRVGLLLNFAMLLVLLNSARLRAAFDLRAALLPVPGRGQLIPAVLFPLSLFLLSLAWTYALRGAINAHRWVRLGVLTLYILTAAAWLVNLVLHSPLSMWAGVVLILLTCALCLLAARRPFPPGLTFASLLLLVGGLFALVQARLLANDRLLGMVSGEAALESNLVALASLVTPLLMLVGFDIAGFAVRAAAWTTALAERLFPAPLSQGLFMAGAAALAGFIVRALLAESAHETWASRWPGYAGAAILVVGSALFWWLLDHTAQQSGTRDPDQLTQAAAGAALPLVLAYVIPALLSLIPLQLGQVVQSLAIQIGGPLQLVGAALYAAGSLYTALVNEWLDTWRLLVAAGLVVTAAGLAVRQRTALALYIGTVGLHNVWVHLTGDGRPLAVLQWQSQEPVIFGWLLLVILVALVWWRRGELDGQRAGRLVFLVCLLALLRQTDFIGDPFSPLLGFTGIGFIAFGIAWDILTAGGWANEGGRWFPQSSRVFLYVGYLLLTVTLVNWAVAAHDLVTDNRYTGDAALAGFFVLGVPFLYSLIPVTLFAPRAQDQPGGSLASTTIHGK